MNTTARSGNDAIAPRPHRPDEPVWTNFPSQLLAPRHWLNWLYEWRDDRWTKIPRRPDGSAGSSTDSATWSSFEAVQEAYYETTRKIPFDGVGIALTPPIIGWDFDHCVDPVSGVITDPRVNKWVGLLDTYFEYSPSRKGLRGFSLGRLPDQDRRLGHYECYDRGRFITLTGRIFGDPRDIKKSQRAIESVHAEMFAERHAKQRASNPNSGSATTSALYLSDVELLDKARAAKNGDHFADLYDRAATAHYPSRSEADRALCALLYFWCGADASRITRLWRASALARAKLNRADYVTRTVEAAIAAGGATYTGQNMNNGGGSNQSHSNGNSGGAHNKGNGIRRASIKLSTVAPKAIEWDWPNVLPRGMVSGWIADPGVGKSIASRDIAARITSGKGYPGGYPCSPGTVIFVDDENGLGDTIRPSIDAQGGDPDKVFVFKLKREPDGADIQFDLGKHLPALREEILEHRDTRLVIIDPPTSYLGDIDETKNAQVRAILTPLKPLAEETNVSVLLLLHFNKAATMDILYRVSGSLAFIELPRITWAFIVDPEDASRRLMLLHMTNITAKDIRGYAFTVTNNVDGRAQLEWCDEPPETQLRDVMAGFSNVKRGRPGTKLDEVEDWLREVLDDHEEHLERDIKQAAKMRGFSEATYIRARAELQRNNLIKSWPKGYGADKVWWMRLEQS